MARRTEEQRITELEAQIVALKAKAQERKVTKDPALKFVSKAIKAIDEAAAETRDVPLRSALGEARNTLSACLQLQEVTLTPKGSATKRVVRSGAVDRDALVGYVRANPGSRGEQIAAAMMTDVNTMRPVMKQLIADRKVRTAGQRRGMTYSPA
jgi:monomeric isocitrate dehydrogenase